MVGNIINKLGEEALFYEVSSNGTFYRTIHSQYAEDYLPAGSVKMNVTGIIKPVAKSSSAISSGIAYTNALNEKLIELTDNSEIIKAQLATPEINVLTRERFDGAGQDDTFIDEIARKPPFDRYSKLGFDDFQISVDWG